MVVNMWVVVLFLRWQTKTPTYDRNRKFTIDVMDNYETSDIAFGRLSGEFIRTQVIPEIDALRFAKYSNEALTTVIGTLNTAQLYISALIDAKNVLGMKQKFQKMIDTYSSHLLSITKC